MIDSFKYSNLKQQNELNRVEYDPADLSPDKDMGFEEYREEMLSKYGWMSPYEFYYGGAPEADIDTNTVLDFEYIESLGKTSEEEIIQADKSSIPNYFWCESLSNWCYFKVTSIIPNFEHKDQWAPQWLRSIAAIATFGGTEILNDISENGLSWDTLWRAPVHIFTSTATGVYGLADQAKAWTSGGRTIQQKYGAITLPFMIYEAITVASKSKVADGEAESTIEYSLPGNPAEIMMPRMCLSLYMWDGYKRVWMPVKSLIDQFARLVSANSLATVQNMTEYQFVRKLLKDGDRWRTGAEREEAIQDWIKAHPLSDIGVDAFRELCDRYTTDEQIPELVFHLTECWMRDPEFTPGLIAGANLATTMNYYMDCRSFEPLIGRTPLSKLQYIGIDNGDKHHWGEHHYIEQWGFWIPLPKDDAKHKLFAKNTFQLYNRQYSYISHDERDHQGWIHKNLGHPCFFRGNDNEIWMAYWLRWTSGNGSESKSGWMWSETTKMSGVYDISKDEIQLWGEILNSMFEKHDDYGYDEWLVNGEYGLSYKKFTVNEEVPNEILTAEDSSLNPDKAPLVNSIEETPENTMILSLSTGTVISREDDNSTLDTAERWK